MLPSLDNFISYGADVFKTRPDYKMMILDIYTTAMNSDQLGENDRVNACKLIESFFLNLRGEVDDVSLFIFHFFSPSFTSDPLPRLFLVSSRYLLLR